jgi:hypothetical protein
MPKKKKKKKKITVDTFSLIRYKEDQIFIASSTE